MRAEAPDIKSNIVYWSPDDRLVASQFSVRDRVILAHSPLSRLVPTCQSFLAFPETWNHKDTYISSLGNSMPGELHPDIALVFQSLVSVDCGLWRGDPGRGPIANILKEKFRPTESAPPLPGHRLPDLATQQVSEALDETPYFAEAVTLGYNRFRIGEDEFAYQTGVIVFNVAVNTITPV